MADQSNPQAAAIQSAIQSLESERESLTRQITLKQARIGVIDTQLSALRAVPATTTAPVAEPTK